MCNELTQGKYAAINARYVCRLSTITRDTGMHSTNFFDDQFNGQHRLPTQDWLLECEPEDWLDKVQTGTASLFSKGSVQRQINYERETQSIAPLPWRTGYMSV